MVMAGVRPGVLYLGCPLLALMVVIPPFGRLHITGQSSSCDVLMFSMNFQDFCLVTPVDFSNPWPLLPLINMGILWSLRLFIRDEVSLREWVYISYSDHRALLSSLNVAGCGGLVYG